MKNKYIIYVLTNPIDSRDFYIGKSCAGLKRPKQHLNPCSLKRDGNKHKVNIIKSILNSGFKPIISILEIFNSDEELTEAEKEWIQAYSNVCNVLTNKTKGGEGCIGRIVSCKTKELLSIKSTGKKHRYESKKKMSESKSGINHPGYGKHRSDVTKLKMSKTNKGSKHYSFGKKKSIETKIKTCISHGGKPIYDESGNFYPSVCEASKILKTLESSIRCVLKGKFKQTKGHSFRYADDMEIKKELLKRIKWTSLI